MATQQRRTGEPPRGEAPHRTTNRRNLEPGAPVRRSQRDLAAPPRRPQRQPYEAIMWLSGLNVLAGIWLIIAPWVLNYSTRDPRWNDVVFGAIVGVLGLTRATGAYRQEWMSWINAAIGVWLFIAAFSIDHTTTASWNDLILGVVVFILAISSAEVTGDIVERARSRR